MADVNNTIRTKVELDSTQAQQDIAKLNAVAADGTKTLQERIEAKNKAAKLQDELSRKTIANLEKEVKALSGVEGKEKQLLAAEKKLNTERVKLAKNTANNEKTQNKLNQSLADSKSSTVALDKASMGLSGSLKALAANPLLAAVTLLIGAFVLLKEAFVSSEEGQDKWNKLLAVGSTIVGNFMDLLSDFANVLVEAFTNPQKAVEQLADTLKNQITNRIEGLIELLPKLGKAASLLFKGKFSEAGKVAADAVGKVALGVDSITDSIKNATEAVGDFIDEQEREIEIAKRIADQRAQADRVERALIVDRAKANRDRAAALEKSVNKEKFSIEERIGFLKEAGRIEQDITNKEIAAAKLRLQAKVAENALANSTKEDLDEEARLRAKIIELETARLTKQKEVTGQIQAFTAEGAAEQARIEAAKIKSDEIEIQRIKANGEETFNLEKSLLDKKRQMELDNEKLTREEKKAINDQYDLLEDQLESERKAKKDAEKLAEQQQSLADLEKEGLDFEEQREILNSRRNLILEDESLSEEQRVEMLDRNASASAKITELEAQAKSQSLSVYTQAAQAATNLIGKETVAGKALAVATTGVQTYLAAQKAYSSQLIPGDPSSPVRAAIAAGTAIASGLANVKNILSVKVPKTSGGGSQLGSGASGINASRGTSTTAVTDISANNAARLGVDPTIGANAESSAANRVAGSSASNVVFSESRYGDFQRQVGFREERSSLS